jgi:peptidoglycan/xylan/chitin deacetylase (PgdA/CDA1 family)
MVVVAAGMVELTATVIDHALVERTQGEHSPAPLAPVILNLNFHGIGSPREREFGDGERDFWVAPAIFEAVLDAVAHRTDVSLSFDDGNTTDVAIALPALRARELWATFFIVPGWLGTPGFIGERDVRELAATGMTIGNHGLAHHDWTDLDSDPLNHEVAEGRRLLEELTDTSVDTLAIPYGAYNADVLETLRGHGYAHVFTSDGGAADREAWLQPREHLRAYHTAADVQRLLSVAS